MSDTGNEGGSYSWREDPLLWAYTLLLLVPVIMSIARYNYYGLAYLVYAGWALMALSIIIIFIAGGEFRRSGGAPEGESIVHTTVLVETGVYSVVRHPQYLGFLLIVAALVALSQHPFSVICAAAGCVLFYRDILREEQMSSSRLGEDYRRYMERVPRLNIIRGIYRRSSRGPGPRE